MGGADVPSRPPVPLEQSRLLSGTKLRRSLVYLIAAALVLLAGTMAVRMALPPDPNARVAVETLPGLANTADAETTAVKWDVETGRTAIDVRESDGAVRRYFLEPADGGGLRIWGGDEAPADRR